MGKVIVREKVHYLTSLLYRHECFTGKYTTTLRIQFHILGLTGDEIDDVIYRFSLLFVQQFVQGGFDTNFNFIF